MFDDPEERRREEARQQRAATIIQQCWQAFLEQRDTVLEEGRRNSLLMGAGGVGSVCVDTLRRKDSESMTNSIGHSGDDRGGSDWATQEEQRAVLVMEYDTLVREREGLLEKNLGYQQFLARHYAEQRRRNGEEEVTQLTTPDADSVYWPLVSQVAEERQRVVGRRVAMEKELDAHQQRYQYIIDEAAMQENNFQQYIQELAATVKFMRSNRPIPNDTIAEYIRREAEQRQVIHASRVKYIQLKNRAARLRRAAKGGGGGDGASPGANTNMYLIDFEQLKVENTNLNEKIEERSEEVVKLRGKVTNSIHILTHVREKLECVKKENADLRQLVASTEGELGGVRDELAKTKKRRDGHIKANVRMKERMPLVGSEGLLLDYEQRKAVTQQHRRRLVQLTDRHTELTSYIKEQELQMVSLRHQLSHYPM